MCRENPRRPGILVEEICYQDQRVCPLTLLAEAFPLCFSAFYCHSLRGFGCSRIVLVVSVPRKRPLQTEHVEHARDENAVTMEFLCHVSVIRCRRRSLLMYS